MNYHSAQLDHAAKAPLTVIALMMSIAGHAASSALAGPPPNCSGFGNCCEPNGNPGCSDFDCCECVCAIDSFCCESEWDAICAGESCSAQFDCGQVCDCCVPDCNENGIPDDEDIAAGTSEDCNDNGIPDEWDIAGYQRVDIIFILDGSGSIGSRHFQVEKDSIVDCLCGPNADIPANGAVAVAVLQFTNIEIVEIAMALIDSPATAQAICDQIDGTPPGRLPKTTSQNRV